MSAPGDDFDVDAELVRELAALDDEPSQVSVAPSIDHDALFTRLRGEFPGKGRANRRRDPEVLFLPAERPWQQDEEDEEETASIPSTSSRMDDQPLTRLMAALQRQDELTSRFAEDLQEAQQLAAQVGSTAECTWIAGVPPSPPMVQAEVAVSQKRPAEQDGELAEILRVSLKRQQLDRPETGPPGPAPSVREAAEEIVAALSSGESVGPEGGSRPSTSSSLGGPPLPPGTPGPSSRPAPPSGSRPSTGYSRPRSSTGVAPDPGPSAAAPPDKASRPPLPEDLDPLALQRILQQRRQQEEAEWEERQLVQRKQAERRRVGLPTWAHVVRRTDPTWTLPLCSQSTGGAGPAAAGGAAASAGGRGGCPGGGGTAPSTRDTAASRAREAGLASSIRSFVPASLRARATVPV